MQTLFISLLNLPCACSYGATKALIELELHPLNYSFFVLNMTVHVKVFGKQQVRLLPGGVCLSDETTGLLSFAELTVCFVPICQAGTMKNLTLLGKAPIAQTLNVMCRTIHLLQNATLLGGRVGM